MLITDEALTAAVQLTDAFVTDRRRPDKAIDALDEACAHTQAVASYSTRAEALIAQRRQLLKERVEGRGSRSEDSAIDSAESGGSQSDGSSERDRDAQDYDDPLERFAQNSVSALERFGAELEAMFTGAQPREPARREKSPPVTTTESNPPPTLTPRPSTLAHLDMELTRQLMEEGIVVRGHDVARVVGLMVGQGVTWSDTTN